MLAVGIPQQPLGLLQLAGLLFHLGGAKRDRSPHHLELFRGHAEMPRHRLDEEAVQRLVGVERGDDASLIFDQGKLFPAQPGELPLGGAALVRLHLHYPCESLQALVHGSASHQPGRETVHEEMQHLGRGQIEEEQPAPEHEGQRDEIDRDLRRQLVGEADREIHDDRVDDERAGDAERQQKRVGQAARDARSSADLRAEACATGIARRRTRSARAGPPSAGR